MFCQIFSYLYLLLLLQIVATQLKMQGKHTKFKNPEIRSGNHCQNNRKFWSILADYINIKVQVHSPTYMKGSTFWVQYSLNFPATLPRTDTPQPMFLVILESHFGKTKHHFIACEGSWQTIAWKSFVSFIKTLWINSFKKWALPKLWIFKKFSAASLYLLLTN